jgi:RNA polymerase-binding transcription factor DksA
MAKRKQAKKLTAKQLDIYRQLLLEKMQEISGDVYTMQESIFQSGGELSSMPVHLADIGTDSYEQEFNLDLMAEEKKILVEIQEALKRIEDGTFGICEGLGIPIEENRLKAIPWTRYSMEYARMLESGQVIKLQNFKRRPIDINREGEIESEGEEVETEGEELAGEELEMEEGMESLDAIEEDEDTDYENEDIERQRDSA